MLQAAYTPVAGSCFNHRISTNRSKHIYIANP
jgi:hypothetical protein